MNTRGSACAGHESVVIRSEADPRPTRFESRKRPGPACARTDFGGRTNQEPITPSTSKSASGPDPHDDPRFAAIRAGRLRPRPVVLAATALGSATVGIAVAWTRAAGQPGSGTLALVLAAVSLVVLARCDLGSTPPRLTAQGLLAIAVGTVQTLSYPPAATPSPALLWPLLAFLAIALALTVGIAVRQLTVLARFEGACARRVRTALDTWLIGASVLALGQALARHCAAGEHRHDPTAVTWVMVGWLCVDMLLFCLAPVLCARPVRGRRAAATLVALVPAVVIGVEGLDALGHATATCTDRLSAATRVAGMLMITFGACLCAGTRTAITVRCRAATGALTVCVPVLACVAIVCAHTLAGHRPDRFTLGIAGSIVAALWMRQCLTHARNLRLSEQLAARRPHIPRQTTRRTR